MEGPHIKLDTGHTYSERPIDGGFARLMAHMDEKDHQLAGLLHELNRSSIRKEIISEALNMSGYDWLALTTISDNQEAKWAFGQLLIDLDAPLETDVELKEEYRKKAFDFAHKL